MSVHQECEFLGSHVPGTKDPGAGPACVPGGSSEGPQEELRACLVVEENGSDLPVTRRGPGLASGTSPEVLAGCWLTAWPRSDVWWLRSEPSG